MARDCPIGVEVFLLLFCCCVLEFSPNLGDWECVFGVCAFFRHYFECWCVCGMSCFVPKYNYYLGNLFFIFIYRWRL